MPLDRMFAVARRADRADGAARGLDDASAEIVDYALTHLGSDLAGLSTREPSGPLLRLAASSPTLAETRRSRGTLGHGPGSEGLEEEAAITIADTRPRTAVARTGARSRRRHGVRPVRLVGMPPLRAGRCSLGLYSHRPDAFTTDGLMVARRAARHVGLTLRHVDRIANLEEAMETRALIGQAQGILMARYGLTSEPGHELPAPPLPADQRQGA